MADARTQLIEEGPFVYAAATVHPLPRARLERPLLAPNVARRVYSSARPPVAYVIACLRRSDPSMLDRLEAALRARASDHDLYHLIVAAWSSPAVRQLALRLISDEALPMESRTALARTLAFNPHLSGERAELEAHLASGRVADEIVVHYYSSRLSDDAVPLERMHALALAYWDRDVDLSERAIDAIGADDSERAVELLRDLAGRGDADDRRAARAREAIERAASRHESDSDVSWYYGEDAILDDANRAVRELPGGAQAVLAARPDALAEVVMALERAVLDSSEPGYVRLGAVRQLIEVQREHALELARRANDPALRSVLEPLRRFPEPGALAAHLAQLGLLPPELASEPGDAVGDLLDRAGRTYSFNTETDEYPNHHDGILAALAELTPGLASVVFEEVPHREDEDDDPEQLPEHYRLRAYTDEHVLEVVAGDTSDWLDVPAMLGLLNTLCRDRQLPTRYVELPTGSQDAEILAAPAGAIERAIDDAILVVSAPGSASESGRAFEDAVIGKRLGR